MRSAREPHTNARNIHTNEGVNNTRLVVEKNPENYDARNETAAWIRSCQTPRHGHRQKQTTFSMGIISHSLTLASDDFGDMFRARHRHTFRHVCALPNVVIIEVSEPRRGAFVGSILRRTIQPQSRQFEGDLQRSFVLERAAVRVHIHEQARWHHRAGLVAYKITSHIKIEGEREHVCGDLSESSFQRHRLSRLVFAPSHTTSNMARLTSRSPRSPCEYPPVPPLRLARVPAVGVAECCGLAR